LTGLDVARLFLTTGSFFSGTIDSEELELESLDTLGLDALNII